MIAYFVDFKSAFNTVKKDVIYKKLYELDIMN